MISGRIFGRISFCKCLFGIKLLLKGGIFRSCNFSENLANNFISYKTESSTLRSYFPEDQMILAEHQLENPASIVDMAVKTAKECPHHLNDTYAKWIVGTVT